MRECVLSNDYRNSKKSVLPVGRGQSGRVYVAWAYLEKVTWTGEVKVICNIIGVYLLILADFTVV